MAKKPRTLIPYKTYMFKEKDPVIDQMRTIVQDSGMKQTAIHEASGVSTACMNAWFHGATRRPQFATVNAVARACGQTLEFKKHKLNGK